MSTKILHIISSSVNPLLLRPVLGVVLAIELLKMEQFMSWLQSVHYADSLFHWRQLWYQ